MLCKLVSLPLLSFLLYILNLKLFCKSLNVIYYCCNFFYHAGTFCARLRARLLVCFDRPVGWKQTVKLHLIKLMHQMMAVTFN